MDSSSDTTTPPKRRRFLPDNPFCDSDDTDNTSYEVPPEKKRFCLQPKPTKSPIELLPMEDTQQDHAPPNADKFANEITFNGAFDDFSVHANERSKLATDYEKVMTQFQHGNSDIEGIEEIQQTFQDLRPFNDVIYLYVRFARQLPASNFNTDSLCSLLCVSKQSNIRPYVFLTKVKSLEIRNNLSKYGVSFSFVTRNTKEIDGVRLEKKFLGLKYTLKLLQSTVTKSEAILGKATIVPKKARTSDPLPPSAKHSSLYSKLWLGIGHRWLAYHVVDHLFSLNTSSSWTNQEIFVFSIQIFATCSKSRYDFLSPLVGLCLQYNNHDEIDLDRLRLTTIHEDPNLFHSFGNICLRDKTHEMRIKGIYETLSTLRTTFQRKRSYRSLSLETKWLSLKAYTYHLWLEQSQNSSIKTTVLQMLSQGKNHESSHGNKDQSGMTPTKQPGTDSTKSRKEPPLPTTRKTTKSTPQPAPNDGGLQVLLQSRQPTNTHHRGHQVNDDSLQLPDILSHSNCDWNNFRLLSTHELNDIVASYLIIRRDDGIDVVSRLSAFEIYSANNLHKLRHGRFNGISNFYPTANTGDVVLNIGNKIDEFMDLASKTFHIAREGSVMFQDHGMLLPAIHNIATLCRAIITHGTCDSKRCSGQRRAFIGNGGLDFPNGIPTTIVDGGFRNKVTADPTFSLDQILKTIGGLSEFLWRIMADMQHRANDSPMAPDQSRHLLYSNHLCTLLSMADCVSFENITLVVSMFHPTTFDLAEHVDTMNDSADGYTRTGTLNMCFMIDNKDNDFQVGLKLQVIGNFRRVIRQYLERTRRTLDPSSVIAGASCEDGQGQVNYQPVDRELFDMAYKFGQCLRNKDSANKIIFEGRKSRVSDGSQTYNNNYTQSKVMFSPYQFKVATFGDVEYAKEQNIGKMKVLGHMEGPRNTSSQVNSFKGFENGSTLLEYLGRRYGKDEELGTMRAASYHQQIMDERSPCNWTIFAGHIDKNFVHTAWFVPLTKARFYTFVAVPELWNVARHNDSERNYKDWVSSLAVDDRTKLSTFQGNFEQDAKAFMKVSNVRVMIYECTVGCFLSFPANLCYHATVSIPSPTNKESEEMKDLLILHPMESG